MKRDYQAKDDDEAASQPVSGLARLRDVDPPPSLVGGGMRRLAQPRPPSLWRWLRRPWVIQLRLSPLSASGMALGLALVAVLALRLPRAPQTPIPSASVSAPAPALASASPSESA